MDKKRRAWLEYTQARSTARGTYLADDGATTEDQITTLEERLTIDQKKLLLMSLRADEIMKNEKGSAG